MTEIVEDTPTTGQKFAAEVLGTFVLVFFGVGAAVMSGGDYVATGLSFGLTVVVMAYAVGRVSGGHFNPAVTVGAALGGRLPWSATPIYVGAQLLGALVAGAVLFGLLHGFEGYTAEGNIGANSFGDQGSGYAAWAAFLLEMVMTAVFVWIILGVTDARNEFQAFMGPLAIGLALAMIHFASMGATGTSVNPARSIGVGVFGGTEAILQLWLFILAPLVGAAIAGLTYPLVLGHGAEPVPGSGLSFGGGRRQQAVYAPPSGYEQQWNQGQPQQWQPAPPAQPWGQDPYAAPAQGQPGQPGPPPPQQWGPPAPRAAARPVGPAGSPAASRPAAGPAPALGPAASGRRRGRPHPGAPTRLTSAAGEVHQLDDLVAGRGLLQHQTDAPRVELVLHDVGLQRGGVLGLEEVVPGAVRRRARGGQVQDPALVLGATLVVLLLEAVADPRRRRHHQPGLRPVDTGLPRALRGRLAPLEGRGVLAEVPDVPGACPGRTSRRCPPRPGRRHR